MLTLLVDFMRSVGISVENSCFCLFVICWYLLQERRQKLDESYYLHRFLADFRDLISWINDMKAIISADELAKDVAGAEALLERHQEHKVNPTIHLWYPVTMICLNCGRVICYIAGIGLWTMKWLAVDWMTGFNSQQRLWAGQGSVPSRSFTSM